MIIIYVQLHLCLLVCNLYSRQKSYRPWPWLASPACKSFFNTKYPGNVNKLQHRKNRKKVHYACIPEKKGVFAN
jgi:hypothetical protein